MILNMLKLDNGKNDWINVLKLNLTLTHNM